MKVGRQCGTGVDVGKGFNLSRATTGHDHMISVSMLMNAVSFPANNTIQ